MTSNIENAISLAQTGKWSEALCAYDELASRDPSDLKVRCNRACLLAAMGRYEEAIDDYCFVIERDKRDPDVRVQCADLLRKKGRMSEAVEILRESLLLRPYDVHALEVWMQCAREKGPREERETLGSTPPGLKALNPVIQALTKDPANFPVSIHPLIGQLLYSFVRCFQPDVVVETGCMIGYSTLHIAQALEENNKGRLHSYDLFAPIKNMNYRSPVLGPSTDSLAIARAHLEAARLSHRVTLHAGDSSTNISKTFPGDAPAIDMAFIDGDHSVGGCMKDWAAIESRLIPGGIVLLHDIEPAVCRYLGPRYLIDEACSSKPNQFQTLKIRTPDGPGLGVVQKMGKEKESDWNPPLLYLAKDALMKLVDFPLRDRRRSKTQS